ncbi:MAG: L-histidine N(alpha)-methyltransferase [Bacteroidales bacterium]
MEKTDTISSIAGDTLAGLTSHPKYLLSKYFYDDNGSKIFRDIMRMPEYYLTDCELEILDTQKELISSEFHDGSHAFDLLELGAGDGLKTKILLDDMIKRKTRFKYIPIDISQMALDILLLDLNRAFPGLRVVGKCGDYFEVMQELREYDNTPRVILFLGSNIGNFSHRESLQFLTQVAGVLNPGDKLFLGFDLKKDPEIILKAYNDPAGHTRKFNLNLLDRLNRELGANFNRDTFRHHPVYDPHSGAAKSYLMSIQDQTVRLEALGRDIHFYKWETIFTEISQKFDTTMIENLATETGFMVRKNFFDKRKYFVNSLWELVW